MTEEGLHFYAILRLATGDTVTKRSADRGALLDWVDTHPVNALLEVGVIAQGPALPSMVAALKFGRTRLTRTESTDA